MNNDKIEVASVRCNNRMRVLLREAFSENHLEVTEYSLNVYGEELVVNCIHIKTSRMDRGHLIPLQLDFENATHKLVAEVISKFSVLEIKF